MKRQLIVPALGLGAVAGLIFAASAQGMPLPAVTGTGTPTASPSPSISPSVTPSPDPEPTDEGGLTADIYFEFNYAVDAPEAPLVSEVTGVLVGDGVELPASRSFYGEGETDYCTAPAVDISEDLTTVTITGADDECGVQVAYLKITLNGWIFGDVTLGADGLFEPRDLPPAQFGPSGAGNGALGSSVRFAEVDIPPTLQDFAVSNSVFEAHWLSEGRGLMSGVTQFNFEPIFTGGAEPVGAEPTFTG